MCMLSLHTGLMTHHRVAESKVFFETRGMNLLSTKVIETALAIIFSEQGQDGLWNQGQVRSYKYSYKTVFYKHSYNTQLL
jgi:hypothetical protein